MMRKQFLTIQFDKEVRKTQKQKKGRTVDFWYLKTYVLYRYLKQKKCSKIESVNLLYPDTSYNEAGSMSLLSNGIFNKSFSLTTKTLIL